MTSYILYLLVCALWGVFLSFAGAPFPTFNFWIGVSLQLLLIITTMRLEK